MKQQPKSAENEEQKRNREIVESIAKNLSSLAQAVNSLLSGPLKKRALVILLANSSKLPQGQVESVLEALKNLEADWLNKQ